MVRQPGGTVQRNRAIDPIRVIAIALALLLASGATFAGAQTTACPSCQSEWAALQPRLLPFPSFPAPNEPVSIEIFDPARSHPNQPGLLTVWREALDPIWIGYQTVQFDSDGFAHALAYALFCDLSEGTYGVAYFDQQTFPAPADDPKLLLRFFVSPAGLMNVVEYFNSALGHYFITGDPSEIEKLDTGVIVGWGRTGESFLAFPPNRIPSFAQPVCRFYGLPSAGLDSHFYSAFPEECAAVKSKWPDKWLLETDAAFGAIQDTYPLDCPDPLFRLYNNRADVNHRYTTSRAIRDQMIAQGWILEAAFFPPHDDPYSMCLP